MIKKLVFCMTVMMLPGLLSAQDLEGIKCIVNPKAGAKATSTAEHMKGTVYFCCNNCAGKFNENPEEYLAAANHQLVATGQYTQKACPISGAAVAEGQSSKVGSTEVGFCCGRCKAKVDGAEDMASQVSMVFGKEAFEKGFQQAESDEIDLTDVTCPMMGEEVSAEFAAEYMGGKVFFCCKRCVASFNEDPEKYATAANHQLVVTGQFAQTACPFSGAPLKDGTEVAVGDHKFGFCCGNCKAKVEGAEDDDARVAMIFATEAFKKGFAPVKKDD
jgi:YHS domain-containing protein